MTGIYRDPLYMKRYRMRRIRNGAVWAGHNSDRMVGGLVSVPAERVQPMLKDLSKVMSWRKIGRLAGISDCTARLIATGGTRRVWPRTAASIEAVWNDYCAPVERDTRRYPVDPLVRAVEARYGSINALGTASRRNLHRMRHTGLSASQADQWALKLVGKLPGEIWDTYGQPETEEAV